METKMKTKDSIDAVETACDGRTKNAMAAFANIEVQS
jgi:hypothetical protein